MAIKTDDEDVRDVHFWMEHGGNGDFYINLLQFNKHGSTDFKPVRIDCRIAMSGGNAPHEVKMAVAALYRTMQAAGLNDYPNK